MGMRAYLETATETELKREFTVCVRAADECQHGEKESDHRSYTWSRHENDMTVDAMVFEISLLEAARMDSPLPQTVLDVQGAVLA